MEPIFHIAFPRIYGPLDRAAVLATEPLEPGADGCFAATPELRCLGGDPHG